MSTGANQLPLSTCGCCAGEPSLAAISNAPGQSAIAFRLATYDIFLQRLVDGLGSAQIPDGPNQGARPLSALTTRLPSDPAIALLDAFAVVADILTFYQERIANEGYLRTATERRSVLELARAVGYELSPGVAASVYLQFTVQEIAAAAATAAAPGSGAPVTAGPGASLYNGGLVDLPAGTQVQSSPSPGNLPQPFETSADFQASVDWNALAPRSQWTPDIALFNGGVYLLADSAAFAAGTYTLLDPAQIYLVNPPSHLALQFQNLQPARSRRRNRGSPPPNGLPALAIKQFYLQGTATKLNVGDRLLLVGVNSSAATQAQSYVVLEVEAQSAFNRTRVAFDASGSTPQFGAASLPQEQPQLGQIPFNQANVDTYIREVAISESDLQAFLQINGWDGGDLEQLVNNPTSAQDPIAGVYAFRATAAFFGANAPKWLSLPDPTKAQRGDAYPMDWDTANSGAGRLIWSDSQGQPFQNADVYLERQFPQVTANGWILLEAHGVQATAFEITGTIDETLADYGMSGKATGLELKLPSAKGTGLNAPSAVSRDTNLLDGFAIGLDGALYHRWWDGSGWFGPENLGGTDLRGSPAAVSWSHDRIDVFAITQNGALIHWWWNGGPWSGAENLGGNSLVGAPAAVSWATNRLDVFATTSAADLAHWWWDGSRWNGPEGRGGSSLVGSPCAVSRDQNLIDVFAIASDAANPGGLMHWWWDGSNWNGPEHRGSAELIGSPSAVCWSNDRIDVFAITNAGGLTHWWWDSQDGWHDLESLGGSQLTGSPSAVAWAANRLDIFVLSALGTLRHFWWDGGWGTEDLGGSGNLIDFPSAVSWGPNRLDIFATGALGHWMHAWWGPGWGGPEDLGDGSLLPYPVRTTKAYLQTEPLALTGLPIADDIAAGTSEIMLDSMTLGLQAGQAVALSGLRADAKSVPANEILILTGIDHIGGFTCLQFAPPGLQNSYLRTSVTISANVALATHGASVSEALGSGDASQTNQTFTLKRPPLTYVSASTPSGAQSSLQIRVNDLAWQEAPTLFGLSPQDQQYIVRLADDGTPSVTFGDPAARLPTGGQNVRATYRTGMGLVGNVGAGTISMLQSRPPGLRAVTNPLAASGGADPQDITEARVNAPLTVLTLDRIVSLQDYENFARSFAGIGKAQAVAMWNGQKRLAHVTIAGADGSAVDPSSPLFAQLTQAILLAHDPVQLVMLGSHQPLTFNLTAAILIDQPLYQPALVRAQVLQALAAAFSFATRAFAQPVTSAEITTLIQSTPGVIAVNLTQLYLSNDRSGPSQTEAAAFIPASAARWANGTIQPAQLLLLNPLGVTMTEMAS
ncbi:putative baseplate assembly protein [Bradyrhizobium sp.]|uniref:putative baseplate assembly protein n=1 Tax=Bradyrhizobium sp. TaxID=376 RepID=UPI003C2A1987